MEDVCAGMAGLEGHGIYDFEGLYKNYNYVNYIMRTFSDDYAP